jgi:hypothetical protein
MSEEQSLMLVQAWAERVLRQVEQVRVLRKRNAQDGRNYERMEDWSPTQFDLDRNFRELWTAEHTMVWAAHQLERWSRRLAVERGQEPREYDQLLADVRNALEHLDEAEFTKDYAVPGDRKSNRSLRKLPDGRLPIDGGYGLAFGLIDREVLEQRALAMVCMVEDELHQEMTDWVTEMMRG